MSSTLQSQSIFNSNARKKNTLQNNFHLVFICLYNNFFHTALVAFISRRKLLENYFIPQK